MSDRSKFQGKCFYSTNGHQWMTRFFDELDQAIRKRLSQSPYNLCTACVIDIAVRKLEFPEPSAYIKAIEEMEQQIAAEEKSAA